MRKIDKTKPVLVTGGTGYLASWIVKLLLEDGISVRATVRDLSDHNKNQNLLSLGEKSNADLSLFEADLLKPGSYAAPMQGCELVIHSASPFFITGIKDPEKELIRPAKMGTENVLEAANQTSSVKRVVLTSSIVAIFGDNIDIRSAPRGIFTENEWNVTSSSAHQPYSYSKTVAEKAAWAMAEKQEQWDLLTINPGWILGPSVSQRTDSMSVSTMIQLGDGTFKTGVPNLYTNVVDVRDVAQAHARAGYTPEASGRHIVVSGGTTLLGIADILRRHFGDSYPFPRRLAPKFIFWLIAPLMGYTRKYVSNNVGIEVRFDNTYSKTDLGMEYIPVERTVIEHFQQIIDDGLVNAA